MGRGDDAGGERGAEGAGLDDEGFDAEGWELVGEGLVDGFDGEFAGGVGGAAGSGDESGCVIGGFWSLGFKGLLCSWMFGDGTGAPMIGDAETTYPAPLLIRTM